MSYFTHLNDTLFGFPFLELQLSQRIVSVKLILRLLSLIKCSRQTLDFAFKLPGFSFPLSRPLLSLSEVVPCSCRRSLLIGSLAFLLLEAFLERLMLAFQDLASVSYPSQLVQFLGLGVSHQVSKILDLFCSRAELLQVRLLSSKTVAILLHEFQRLCGRLFVPGREFGLHLQTIDLYLVIS